MTEAQIFILAIPCFALVMVVFGLAVLFFWSAGGFKDISMSDGCYDEREEPK